MADTTTAASCYVDFSQWLGAFGFGALIGWNAYYINRYRKEVAIADLGAVVGAIAGTLGGAAITALFSNGGALFGAYGIGLFTGFFGYFAFLLWLVHRSKSFTFEYFLDGRRPRLDEAKEQPSDGSRAFGVEATPASFSAPSARGNDSLSFDVEAMPSQPDFETMIGECEAAESALSARPDLLTSRINLSRKIENLKASALRAKFDGADVQAAVTQLQLSAKTLKDEAQNMKDAQQVIATASKVLGYIDKVVSMASKVV